KLIPNLIAEFGQDRRLIWNAIIQAFQQKKEGTQNGKVDASGNSGKPIAQVGPVTKETVTGKKRCPVCGIEIERTATKCINCDEYIDEYTRGAWKWFGWTGLKRKSLWDWLSLLIVPLVLAGGGFLLNNLQEQRVDAIEANRTNANNLQSYLDDMTT